MRQPATLVVATGSSNCRSTVSERDIGTDYESELIEEPSQDIWDESDETQAQWAEEISLAEDDTKGPQETVDEFLLDEFTVQTDARISAVPVATGPLTRRLAEMNASRPLRPAPITLRLNEGTPLTLDSMVTDVAQQKASSRSGSRRSGCSLVAVLLVLLCVSSVATLMRTGIWPSLPNPLTVLRGGSLGSHIHLAATPTVTTVSSTATGVPIVGGAATPGATAGTGGGPTPTSITGSTATVSPYARSATITFAAATQSLSSPSSLNVCPSGCDIPAVMDTPSRSFLHSQHTSGGSPYWAVDILFTTGSSGHVGSVSPSGSVNGRPVTCQNAPFNVNIGGGQSAWFQCMPTVVPVPANAFGCSNCFGFNYTDPYGSYQDTSNEYVTQQDCISAENSAQGQATSWEQSYTPNVGPQLVSESVWTDTISCSPAVNQHGTTVTGSVWGHVRAEGFDPADAKTTALTQLDALLPSGYIWMTSGTSISSTTCSPTWTSPASGSTMFTVACTDSDVAIQEWTPTSEQHLAASLAGLPLNQAVQDCDAATRSVCKISLSGGNNTDLPLSTANIIIAVS